MNLNQKRLDFAYGFKLLVALCLTASVGAPWQGARLSAEDRAIAKSESATDVTTKADSSAKAEEKSGDKAVETLTENAEQPVEPAKELFSGKVVLLVDALKRRGIKAADEMKGQAALESTTGELWPLIADWRGRAFFQDERLRDRPVELVVRRHKGLPYLQVLMVFTFNEQGEREYTDYWCDICSIPMYEIKDCDCCRGPIRLRFQKQDLPGYIKSSFKTQATSTSPTSSDQK